ncbi:MAG TPA: DUF2294 domain-containing protein, partial [Solirubrobacteraceae bacterium]|nr:DUF2294 domain-containing protein [Solirubrobacteraceae bacterium]
MSHAQATHPPDGELTASISNMVVRTLSEYTGRGPTKARSYVNGDLVVVLLQDTLTKGERSLARGGEHHRVLDTRKAYQRTMRDELESGILALTGRRVIAFMSDNHIDPDMGVEVFVLESNGA